MSGDVANIVYSDTVMPRTDEPSWLTQVIVPKRGCRYKCARSLFNNEWKFIKLERYVTPGKRSTLVDAIDKAIDELKLYKPDQEIASVQHICLKSSTEHSTVFDMLDIVTAVSDPDRWVARHVDRKTLRSSPEFQNLAIQNAAMISYDLESSGRVASLWKLVGKNLAENKKKSVGFSIDDNICRIVIGVDVMFVNGVTI
jgi:hypothetical protein